MAAYYNEIDPIAAAWLRELIKAGLIAPGDVDERSIEDVVPSELTGYTQCHFFAGIGVWSYALRRAGWPDDRPVWTGSCPCQPFSAAGKGGGFTDERHLWPAFHHLVSQCRPVTVFGEQVASKDGLAWLDLVQTDLEGTGYTVGAVDTCAAGFGAPHIRQRLYWVADAKSSRRQYVADVHGGGGARNQSPEQRSKSGIALSVSSLADAQRRTAERHGQPVGGAATGVPCKEQQRERVWLDARDGSIAGRLDYPLVARLERYTGDERDGGEPGRDGEAETRSVTATSSTSRPGPVNGFWGVADWLFCRDGKWRAVEPGTFPLVDVAPARVGRLRGYGNAIVAVQAEAFIRAYLDING